jgi:RimJ/RimL family protein N-acetyltransferase
MELRDLTADDLWLYEAINLDPAMMSELGGPVPREGLAEKLRRDAADVAADRSWVLVIVPEKGSSAAGTVSVWDHEWTRRRITEIGWMVLPRFQGRGLATEAVAATLERVRASGRWDVLHAFPATSNAASNAICRKEGFSLVEECDYEFRGRALRCNHWRLDLRRTS